MNESSFIKNEQLSSSSDLVGLNFRLFSSLPLFLKLTPLTFISILLASAAPSLFRWYAGHYTSGTDKKFTLVGLFWIVGLSIFFRIAAWVLFELSAMWSSQTLYLSMIRSLSGTRTTFFDENPSGRIMNRLIRDFEELRTTAIIFMGDSFNAFIEVLSIAAVACLASPWVVLAIIPLFASFLFIQSKRSKAIEHSRNLASIESSQVINRKNDLIEGREIFILYGKSELLLNRMKDSLRAYLRTSLLTLKIDSWASLWIRLSAETFSLIVLLISIGALHTHRLDITVAGVIISALFGITGSIQWLDFASSMVSRSVPHLRRVFEFIDLPPEEAEERQPIHPTSFAAPTLSQIECSHPSLRGDIVFQNYSMSYRKGLPRTLHNLNLIIREGSKTAIIGRTGSGKSSIIQSLLRMVHVQHGDILIGNKSIFQLDIQSLRKHYGIVPQFPYLFEGNIHSNLDRTGTLSKDQLRTALSEVGLNFGLQDHVSEGGMNLSIGQRQLLCLARVVACNRSIILMDEPTSGLDPVTDARLSWILRTILREKTVITIAHRRETVQDYDSTIELQNGVVI